MILFFVGSSFRFYSPLQTGDIFTVYANLQDATLYFKKSGAKIATLEVMMRDDEDRLHLSINTGTRLGCHVITAGS